jgi:phosphoribosylpyrophosphate synthetase
MSKTAQFSNLILKKIKFIILKQIPDYHNAVIVAKNPLAAKRASSYAERLRLGIAFMHGEVKVS